MAFEFDRYVNGQLMAEGVIIERQTNLPDAMRAAARIASRGPNGEAPVLVLRAMLAAATNSGLVTAEMLEAAARAILKAEWELAGETPEDAAWIADSIIDGIADDCEDDALAARMAAHAAFEAIGLTVEG